TPVFAAAIALEIIYDAALFGKPFENSRQNPALALCICCIGAFLFERYREKRAVFFLVGAACILWAAIIRADHGIPVALSFFILELTQKKTAARPLALAAALSLCTVASPFCALSPLGALFVRSDDQRLR
ncbi:MAG: hypothetical protein IKL24_03450, partial [Clostridia bacterium]|nr:hypothetical protein [Clostridia bacterium]